MRAGVVRHDAARETRHTGGTMARLNRIVTFWAGLLVALPLGLLSGCDDATKPLERQVIVEVDPDRTIDPDAPRPDLDGDGRPDPLPPGTVGSRILVIAGEAEKSVHREGAVELGVLLLDHLGDPVEGEQIQYAIAEDAPGAAVLSARRTITDDTGYGKVEFRAGGDLGTFEVEVWHPESRRLKFTVHVVDLPTGGLDIGFEYEGPVPLGLLETYVIDDPEHCDDPYYLLPPEDVVFSSNVERPDDRLLVEPLLAGTRVSVVVRGRLAANGVLAGGGCVGDLVIRDGERQRVQVSMFLLPLNAAGTYTVNNHFDFSDAIPGTLGDVIRGLVRFFGDRNHEREIAGLIFDLVENLVRQAAGAIGGLIVDLVRGWVEDDLNDIINDYIDNDAPDWVRDFFTIGTDLVSVVSDMEVISRMRISKPRRDGTFDGSQNWIGLAFYWRLPCQGNPDPQCGRYAFTMNEVAAAAEGIELVFGQFTGRIHSYNQGIIDPHTMDLQYGRLILFVLNNIILPFIADGANNLRDALLNLANCPAFANGITGGGGHLRIAGINIASRDTIEGWCRTVIGLAGDAASAIIGRLRVDTRLTLQGTMVLLEESDDLVVDALQSGVWTGVIRTNQDEGPPFRGDFEGTRDVADAEP